MKLHMIIEQTYKYKKRMIFNPDDYTFTESEYTSLGYARNFKYPYGWIKESGTPPEPHWDVMLMSDNNYRLGDETEIRIVGVFKRNDGDLKFIAVEYSRNIDDYSQLTDIEIAALHKLYPNIRQGEGWFGKDKAINLYNSCEKAL